MTTISQLFRFTAERSPAWLVVVDFTFWPPLTCRPAFVIGRQGHTSPSLCHWGPFHILPRFLIHFPIGSLRQLPASLGQDAAEWGFFLPTTPPHENRTSLL